MLRKELFHFGLFQLRKVVISTSIQLLMIYASTIPKDHPVSRKSETVRLISHWRDLFERNLRNSVHLGAHGYAYCPFQALALSRVATRLYSSLTPAIAARYSAAPALCDTGVRIWLSLKVEDVSDLSSNLGHVQAQDVHKYGSKIRCLYLDHSGICLWQKKMLFFAWYRIISASYRIFYINVFLFKSSI